VASAITHAAFAVALGTAFHARVRPLRVWLLGAACAVAPDLDVLSFRLGIPYEAPLGHRGASHSLAAAAALAAALAVAAFRPGADANGVGARRAFAFLFLATASHGALDALTNGGLGVAFLWPFDDARHFFPARPLEVSPLGVRAFLSSRGAAVLANEVVWVWLPAAAFAACCLCSRRRRPDGGRAT
jgi:inner membrane protein